MDAASRLGSDIVITVFRRHEECEYIINLDSCEYQSILIRSFTSLKLFFTDLEPPKINSCPDDIKIISLVRWHKLVLPAVNINDNVGVNLFTTNIQNGSNITWGVYNISYRASDKAGNKAQCSFLITIAGMYELWGTSKASNGGQ